MKAMPEDKSLAIDVTKENALVQIFPCAPLFLRQVSWSHIHLAHYRLPACRIPEIYFAQHIISIHDGCSVLKKRVLKGHSRTEQFNKGDISITPANQCRTVHLYGKAEFIHLYLEPTFITQAANELIDADGVEIVPQFKLCDRLIQVIGLALKAELETDGLSSRLYVESLINTLCVHLLRHYATKKHTVREYTGGLPKFKLRQAIEYINDNLAGDLSVSAISREIGMSQYHFARLFKKTVGLTPHQYVIQCRVQRAQQLLHDDLSIAEVAYSVGFADQSHLTHHFKRLMGVTPKALKT